MSKILAIGNAVIDWVVNAPTFPNENSETRVHDIQQKIGGNAINTLNILHQLNHQVAWCGSYANDVSGQQMIEKIEAMGIDAQFAESHKKGHTPTSVVINTQDSHTRTIMHHRNLPELSFEHFAKQSIENHDWIHFEGRNIEQLEGMINLARCFLSYQKISLEVEKNRLGIETLFNKVDVLIFSKAYANATGEDNPERFLASLSSSIDEHIAVFLAWGEKGAWALHQGKITHQSATPQLKIIDTLAAGDVFNAGIIDALIHQMSINDALAHAVILAEKKIQQHGLNNLFVNDNKPKLIHLEQLTAHKVKVIDQQGQSIALLRHKDGVKAYLNNCPHANVPLNSMYKIEVDPRSLTLKCSVHDALFDIETGQCVKGPCKNQGLEEVICHIDDQGNVYLSK